MRLRPDSVPASAICNMLRHPPASRPRPLRCRSTGPAPPSSRPPSPARTRRRLSRRPSSVAWWASSTWWPRVRAGACALWLRRLLWLYSHGCIHPSPCDSASASMRHVPVPYIWGPVSRKNPLSNVCTVLRIVALHAVTTPLPPRSPLQTPAARWRRRVRRPDLRSGEWFAGDVAICAPLPVELYDSQQLGRVVRSATRPWRTNLSPLQAWPATCLQRGSAHPEAVEPRARHRQRRRPRPLRGPCPVWRGRHRGQQRRRRGRHGWQP